MTCWRLWRLSVAKDGEVTDLQVTPIGAGSGLLRLDLFASVPPDHQRSDRHCTVVDLDTARAMAILLIRGIEQAELDEARNTPRRKKK